MLFIFYLFSCGESNSLINETWRLHDWEVTPVCTFPEAEDDPPLIDAIMNAEENATLSMYSSNDFTFKCESGELTGTFKRVTADSIVFVLNGVVYPGVIEKQYQDSMVLVLANGNHFKDLKMTWIRGETK